MYLWWSLRTLYLLAYQVWSTVGDSGLPYCVCVTSFERWLTPSFLDYAYAGSCVGPRNNKITLLMATSDLTRFTWWVPARRQMGTKSCAVGRTLKSKNGVQRPVTAAGRSGEPGPVCPPVGRGSRRGRARAPTPPPTSVDNPARVQAATTNSALDCPAAAVGERLRWWWWWWWNSWQRSDHLSY